MSEQSEPIERASAALEAICEVVASLSCPYYRGEPEGKCRSGCYTEPRCVTDGPQNPRGLDQEIADLVLALDEIPNTDKMAERVRRRLERDANT